MKLNLQDRWIGVGLMTVAVLLGANLLVKAGVSDTPTGTTPNPPGRVQGGLPDSGAQLLAILDELKATNRRLDAMQKLLESGNLTVKAKLPEKETK